MRTLIFACLMLAVTIVPAAADGHGHKGLIIKESPHSVTETLDRMEAALKSKGMTIFTRFQHAEGAKSVGLDLPATQVLVFGNPKLGTKLMQSSRSIAIDLPLKALAWEENGKVYLAYNDPNFLAKRHGVEAPKVIGKMSKALDNFSNAAVKP